jgi:transcriptional regulator with XRE-family HTH domain
MSPATVRPADFTAARKRSGKSQRDVATDIGCSDVHITLIEQGRRNPSLPLLIKAAESLGVGIEEIADIHITADEIEALAKAVA